MQTTSISASAAAGAAPAGTGAAKPSQQFDYMKLIVAQMQNLNPMDPSSGGDSLPTMMQAESLNQLTKLNQALTDLQTMTQTSYASTLLGRGVRGVDQSGTEVTGTVTGLEMDAGGPLLQLANGKRLRLLDIASVQS